MGLYDLLKQLENNHDSELYENVKSLFAPSSPLGIIRLSYAQQKSIESITRIYFQEEHEKNYGLMDCFQKNENKAGNELQFMLDLPMAKKQDSINALHNQTLFYWGILGTISYFGGITGIPLAIIGIWGSWATMSTYNDLLNAPKNFIDYEAEAITRAQYLDAHLQKLKENLKNTY